MARARTLKPGFFKNEALAECEPLARILFQGLWAHADRNGRLENRPKRLKAEILPYDDCDIPSFLRQLAERGFILCYEVAGTEFIQVVTFAKHQKPHPHEAMGEIPAPGDDLGITEGLEGRSSAAGPRTPPREPSDHVGPLQPIVIVDAVKCNDKTRPDMTFHDQAVTNDIQAGPSPSSLLPSPLSEPKGSEPDGSRLESPLDLKRELWRVGKGFLGRHGIKEKQAGSLLGAWRRDYGDTAVLAALAAAEAECPSDAVEFIVACLQRAAGKRNAARSPPEKKPKSLVVGTPEYVAAMKEAGA